ncbi:hypothetical protein [Synechococcus sp. O70.2]|jgi:hypothetical protein|uniref:hypothetical protein n=1 Tax=unclassified Synechococcus TaxID=2626047 RepID=UPI0039C36410
MAGPDPQSFEHDCATLCRDGCVLGEACPHREAARRAVDFIMNTDWETLMRLAESRNLPKTPPQEDPLQFLENYRLGG